MFSTDVINTYISKSDLGPDIEPVLAQEKMKDSQKQLEALTAQMGRLMQEKAELETRNRILEQVSFMSRG